MRKRKKHEPSQALSVYDCVLSVEEREEVAQLSIPFPVQEQETIAKQLTFPDLKSFSDHILHRTNWFRLFTRCKAICHDKGLSSQGGSNFSRVRLFERALAHSVDGGFHVDNIFDLYIKSDRIEAKFMSKNNEVIELIVKKTRGSASKKDLELQRIDPILFEEQKLKKAEKAYQDWLKDDRYDYMILFNYTELRMYVTTSEFVKNHTYLNRACISSIFSVNDPGVIEIDWRSIIDPSSIPVFTTTDYSAMNEETTQNWEAQFP